MVHRVVQLRFFRFEVGDVLEGDDSTNCATFRVVLYVVLAIDPAYRSIRTDNAVFKRWRRSACQAGLLRCLRYLVAVGRMVELPHVLGSIAGVTTLDSKDRTGPRRP